MRKMLIVSLLVMLFRALNAHSSNLDLLGVGWRSQPGGRPSVTVAINAEEGVTARAIGDIVLAISNWNTALLTHLYAPFLGTVHERKANITIHMKVSEGTVLGMTSWETVTPQSCVLKSVDIRLSGKAFGQDFSHAETINVALHELGHALGLGPSDEPSDLMYAYAGISKFFGTSMVSISPCDLMGIDRTYPLNPFCMISSRISCR
jgi:predicted Zn-dependent protease